MKNNFINNNGVNLLHTKNKKTKVESRILLSVNADNNQNAEMQSIPGGQITK